jgi:hypothetical protein
MLFHDGGTERNDVRTSDGMSFVHGGDGEAVIEEVELRRSKWTWTMLPVGQGEGIQVLRCHDGQ